MPQTSNLIYIVMKKKARKSCTVFFRKKARKNVESPLWLSPNNITQFIMMSWYKIIYSSILPEIFSSASKSIFSKKNGHMMRQPQNQSELKYSIVWGRFLKRLFCCIYSASGFRSVMFWPNLMTVYAEGRYHVLTQGIRKIKASSINKCCCY